MRHLLIMLAAAILVTGCDRQNTWLKKKQQDCYETAVYRETRHEAFKDCYERSAAEFLASDALDEKQRKMAAELAPQQHCYSLPTHEAFQTCLEEEHAKWNRPK